MTANRDLVEDIRDYWSRRAATFDLAFGHHIAPGAEAQAWSGPMRDHIGPAPQRVLELACGTGEVTRLVHDPIAQVQRRTNGLRNRLRTRVYDRFILHAHKPQEADRSAA